MSEIDLSLDCMTVARTLSHYTIGFALKRCDGNVENAVACGSGSLVTVGGVRGVVTARHVIERIRHEPEVGLLRFPINEAAIQCHWIEVGKTEFECLAGSDGPLGPDLGFVRLPHATEALLASTNNHYPLDGERPPMEGSYRGLGMCEFVMGIVEEWTADLELTAERRLKKFMLLATDGFTADTRKHAGLDLGTFKPNAGANIGPPKSYGGISGGGLWRVFFKPDSSNEVVHRRLIGTAFYEVPVDGVMQIVHHGPKALEEKLVAAVRARWKAAAQP